MVEGLEGGRKTDAAAEDRVIAGWLIGGSAPVGRVKNEAQLCHKFNGGPLGKTSYQKFVFRVKLCALLLV